MTNLKGVYKQKIHQAVLAGGEFDPYTGEKLNWEGISPKDAVVYGYVSDFLTKYAMLPAVDHISADKFEFEICAWIVNSSKTCMTPDEYVELCGKVTAYRQPAKAKAQAVGRSAKKGRR